MHPQRPSLHVEIAFAHPLAKAVDSDKLPAADQLYLARCFDLLDMELESMREYLHGMSGR